MPALDGVAGVSSGTGVSPSIGVSSGTGVSPSIGVSSGTGVSNLILSDTVTSIVSTSLLHMPISIQLFTASSSVMAHPSVVVSVPSDYKILGGGAFDHYTGFGNILTASYPQSLQTWFVAGKDHEQSDPASITGYALALHDPNNDWDVAITQNNSLPLPHPQADVNVKLGYVMTGGGAFVNYHGAGNLLTASFPVAANTWRAQSKDHDVHDPAEITAYAIGVRRRIGRNAEQLLQSTTGSEAAHPSAQICLSDSSYTLCGGGAVDNWNGDGNLLTASYPQNNCWMAAGKDHKHSSPATITAYVLGIRLPAIG